jgi:AraC-like DNA-binding protein
MNDIDGIDLVRSVPLHQDPDGLARQFRRAPMLAGLRPLVLAARDQVIGPEWRHRGLSGFIRIYAADRPGAEVRCGARRFPLGGDHLLVLPPEPAVDTACTRKLRHFFVHAELPEFSHAQLRRALPGPKIVPLDPHLRALRDACWSGCERDGDDAAWAGRLVAYAALVFTAALDLDDWQPGHGRLDGVVWWLRERLHRPISDGELAKVHGTGIDGFIRAFRKATGMTPQVFINHERLRKVADLLRAGDEPVAEIARRCGFNDPLYCTRRFTRAYGCPPTAWRQRGRDLR